MRTATTLCALVLLAGCGGAGDRGKVQSAVKDQLARTLAPAGDARVRDVSCDHRSGPDWACVVHASVGGVSTTTNVSARLVDGRVTVR
jgi:hypothetical protein